jgi:signal transduction histidine kinase
VRYLYLLLLPVTLLGGLQSMAQTRLDSLEMVLQKELPDSIRLTALNALATEYYDINIDRYVDICREALAISAGFSSPALLAKTYDNYALATEGIGEYQTSIEYNNKALLLYQLLGDSLRMASVLNNMGIAYNQLGDYSMAIYYLLKAIEIDEARKDTISSCYDYINIAEAYYYAKNFEESERWGKKSYAYLRGQHDDEATSYAAETLATTFIELGKLDSARLLVSFSKTTAVLTQNQYLFARSFCHMGRIYLKEEKYDSARVSFLQAIKNSEGKFVSDVLLPSLILLSKCYLYLGQTQEALEHAEEAYTTSVSVKNKMLALSSCAVLAEIHQASKRPAEAIRYLHLASLYKDTILEQSVRGSMQAKAFDLRLESEKRERQKVVAGLEEKDRTLARQRYLMALALLIMVSLLTILYLVRKVGLERKKTNDLLTSKNLQLNKLNQEVNGLINTIVHDLKSPLNSMQGILMVLEKDVAGNAMAQEMITHGHRVLEGGHEIIKELLELRELEERVTTLTLESTSLKELLDSVCEEFLPYAKQKQIELKAEVTETIVAVDQHMVKRLLGNLVSNAIKYSPSGKPVSVRAWKNTHEVFFEVADNGLGFRESDLGKMYGKFQKLSARPTAGESSHGLGLAIVQLLAKRLNAKIDLQTEWGKGSTFTITMPV